MIAKRIKLLSREPSQSKTERIKSPVGIYNLRKLSKEQVIEELKSPIVVRLDFHRSPNDREKVAVSNRPRKKSINNWTLDRALGEAQGDVMPTEKAVGRV